MTKKKMDKNIVTLPDENYPQYIEPVNIDELEKSCESAVVDSGTSKLIQAEQAYIRAWRKQRKGEEVTEREDEVEEAEPQNLIGLASPVVVSVPPLSHWGSCRLWPIRG